MKARSLTARLALWAVVCALLLRAGMPLVAVAAAQQRGVPLGEVCEVYGVVMPDPQAQAMPGHAHHHAAHGHPHHHGANAEDDHGCGHCALGALGALAAPDSASPLFANPPDAGPTAATFSTDSPVHDACAAWAARLGHGPPVRA